MEFQMQNTKNKLWLCEYKNILKKMIVEQILVDYRELERDVPKTA